MEKLTKEEKNRQISKEVKISVVLYVCFFYGGILRDMALQDSAVRRIPSLWVYRCGFF